MLVDRRIFAHFDFALLIAALLVPIFGILVLFSAGYSPDSTATIMGLPIRSYPAFKQLVFLGVGIIAMFIGLSLSSLALERWAYGFYAVCVSMLVAVLLFGNVSKGARRWLNFGAFNIQPSEITKIAIILALARYLSRMSLPKKGLDFKHLIIPALMLLIPAFLDAKQPDLGTAIVSAAVGGMMLLFIGIRLRVIVTICLFGAIVAVPAWNHLHDYQRMRILTLFNPEADPMGAGYHLNQSKIAVGSGGFLGKGFLKGTQTQLEFLPEHTTDFVFSVLAEEQGFIGSFLLIALYAALVTLLLRVVTRTRSLFNSLVAFGMASMIFFHTVVNLGMVTGILPVVGITLPMFSYGGSSLISMLFGIGIVLGISMRRFAI